MKDIHSQTAALDAVEKQWKTISDSIDLINSQQKIINQLYDTNIAIGESIPGIQAEYNLMVDQMARQDMPSNQVVLAKTKYLLRNVFFALLTQYLQGMIILVNQPMTLVQTLKHLVPI